MIFTSNFKIAGHLPNTIAVCRSVPRGWPGPRLPPLAPSRELLKMGINREVDVKTWAVLYKQQVLDKLTPEAVLDALGGDNFIMLCWEPPGEPCHRRYIAIWLKLTLGLEIPELDLNLKTHRKILKEWGAAI
ncbi:MAG: hypothetical protein ACLFUU_05915 [Desulfobacteraceae bacterium]